MAHGIGEVVSADGTTMKSSHENNHQQTGHHQAMQQQPVSQTGRKNVGVMGSRRIFAAAFKLKVLDSYRNDIDCRGNQRATARKYGIHRRQIQKWLQCEDNLRSSCAESHSTTTVTSSGCCTVPVASGAGTVSSLSIAARNEIISQTDGTTTGSSSVSGTSMNGVNGGQRDNCNGVGTPVLTPSQATPAPALNLTLARLHGDEQQHQQLAARPGPPPHLPSGPPGASLRHSGRRGSSPTSLRYLQPNHNSHRHAAPSSSPNPVPLRNMLAGYAEYASQQDPMQHNNQRHHRRQHPNEHLSHDEEHHMRQQMARNSSNTAETKYSYVINRTPANYERRDILSATGPSRSPNSEAYYPTLESYHNNVGFVGLGGSGNNDNNEANKIGLASGASPSYRENNVDAAGNTREPSPPPPPTQTTSFASASSPLVMLHATAIKTERASPDSLATPGPCETPGSPESAASVPWVRLNNHRQRQNEQHQRQSPPSRSTDVGSDTCNANPIDVCTASTKKNVANRGSAAAAIATASTVAGAAVLSSETTSPLAHVHVRVDLHAPNARDSRNQHLEREHQPELHRRGVNAEYEARMGRRVKEEIVEREDLETAACTANTADPTTMTTATGEAKREMSEEEALIEHSRYHRERMADIVASCPDYQGPTAVVTRTGLSSGDQSGLGSPMVRESTGSYSGLSSPRAASSSGISTSSSCSDSEIDPLDYSSNSARNPITDLSRRRSFSLRFKLDVLDAFHGDPGVAGNQRATARKFGINRRQVQKWLGQESELRGEIALRGGDLRQRLGPMTETPNIETSIPVDLRTSSTVNYPVAGFKSETEHEHSSPPLYCCDVGSSPQTLGYYHHGHHASLPEFSELQPRTCALSCCVDGLAPASMMCYQDSVCHRRSSLGYPESQGSLYCYSPRDAADNGSGSEGIDVTASSSPMKRTACALTCCYDAMPSPKRVCHETIEERRSSPIVQDLPPQEAPLCLVKPKSCFENSSVHTEPVTSTVPTPPARLVSPAATSASKKNAILFKPYLDNPVSKPTDETHIANQSNHRGLSPLSAHSVIVNNNNNCHGICNLNEERSIVRNTQHDYALELSLRVPVTWQTHHGGYGEFPESIRSAFVRYPTSPHYT